MRALAALCCLTALFAACTSSTPGDGAELSLPPLPSGLPAVPDSVPGAVQGTLRIHAVGDSMLHTELLDVEPDFGDLLVDMQGLFLEDDLTLLNLECPASEVGTAAPESQFALRCDQRGLLALAAAGVDVVSVANDASLNLGQEAADDTALAIEAAGMVVVGADAAPALIERRGRTIAVFGFTTLGPRALTPEQMEESIAQGAAESDAVLVTMHWGEPEDRDPNSEEVALAQRLVAAGADAIYGHGPHRLQSLRIVSDAPVVFSLGHFIWPLNNERDPDTAVAYTEIDEDNGARTCLLPATIRTNGRPALDRPDAGCDIGSVASLGTG